MNKRFILVGLLIGFLAGVNIELRMHNYALTKQLVNEQARVQMLIDKGVGVWTLEKTP